MKNKLVLITGASGFIGKHLTKLLLEKNYDLLLTYCNGRIDKVFNNYTSQMKLDLTRKQELKKIPKNIKAVFHLSCFAPDTDSYSVMQNTLNVNSYGTLNLLLRCCELGIKRFINSSSVSIYGNYRHGKISERCIPKPVSYYGISKLLGEMYCDKLTGLNKINAISLRYSSVYGVGQHSNTVLPVFIRNAIKDNDIKIFGKGKKVQDFVYVKDVVEANCLALNSNQSGPFNISSGDGTNIIHLSNLIKDVFKANKSKILFDNKKTGDDTIHYFDCSKAKTKIGYKVNFSLKKGLLDYKKELKETKSIWK